MDSVEHKNNRETQKQCQMRIYPLDNKKFIGTLDIVPSKDETESIPMIVLLDRSASMQNQINIFTAEKGFYVFVFD